MMARIITVRAFGRNDLCGSAISNNRPTKGFVMAMVHQTEPAARRYVNGHSNESPLEHLLRSPEALANVVRRILGEENKPLSSRRELRFGTHGSISVDLEKGTFFDHEANRGGGILDLISQKIGGDRSDGVRWLSEEGFLEVGTTQITTASDGSRGARQQVAVYDYDDEHGVLNFQVVRFHPKDFRQRRRGDGGWIWDTKGTRRPPYKLPELLEAIAAQRIVAIHEGEKDVDASWALNIPATCNAGGAKKWTAEHSSYLKGADVVVLPDNDAPGREHAELVAHSLVGIASRIRVLTLPGLPEKGDFSDWVASGGTAAEFWSLVERAEDWRPGGNSAASEEQAAPDMSIIRRNQMPAPKFPTEVLGPNAADWVTRTAQTKNAPVDYVALSLIVTTAGVLGPKRRIEPWEGWSEPSILWGCLVGPPSTNKSPSTDSLRDGVRAIECELNEDWETRKANFEKEKTKSTAYRTAWEQAVASSVKSGDAPPDLPADAVTPSNPTKHRVWVVDATTEKIARILGENPRGLLCFRDELAGLLGGFDKYGGSGTDRAFWIEAFGGRSYRYDRVKLDDSVDIRFCAVSILGAIQPDRLHSMLLSGDDDGLASRFLYAWPDPVQPRRPHEAIDSFALVAALRRLVAITFDAAEDDELRPKTIRLEEAAADEFQGWWEREQWAAKEAATGQLASAVGKLDGITLRLAQVLEYLTWSWRQSNTEEPERVSLASIRNAIELVENWVRPTLARVFAEASLPKSQRDAMTIGRWLLKSPRLRINARNLRREAGFPGPKDPDQLDAALEVLVDGAWLVPVVREAGSRGRAPKDYEVNPRLYGSGN